MPDLKILQSELSALFNHAVSDELRHPYTGAAGLLYGGMFTGQREYLETELLQGQTPSCPGYCTGGFDMANC